jgi:rubrerythrin
MEIRKIYEYALAREHEGKRFFETNAERLSHSAAVSAFRRLAQEEQRHIEFIEFQLSLMDQQQPTSPETGEKLDKESFFDQRAKNEGTEQSVSEAMLPDLPVLRMAYLIERDFAEFYEQASKRSTGDAIQVLALLSQWERVHERYFKNWHDKVFQEYAKMPWGG